MMAAVPESYHHEEEPPPHLSINNVNVSVIARDWVSLLAAIKLIK